MSSRCFNPTHPFAARAGALPGAKLLRAGLGRAVALPAAGGGTSRAGGLSARVRESGNSNRFFEALGLSLDVRRRSDGGPDAAGVSLLFFFRLLMPLLAFTSVETLYLVLQIITSFATLACVYWLARSIFRTACCGTGRGHYPRAGPSAGAGR